MTGSPTPSGQPLPTTDTPAQDVVNVVETLEKAGEQSAETAIIAAEPWMGAPFIKQIWEGALDWLVNLIGKPLATLGGYVMVDAQEYFALKNAASAQIALNVAKQKGDQNAIEQASQNVDAAVAPVLHYMGSTQS